MAPRSKAQREWHVRNADRVKRVNDAWIAAHPDAAAERQRAYRERHGEKARARQAGYDKKRWAEDKDAMVAKHKKWKAENPEAWASLNKASDLRVKYGLSISEFNAMMAAQGSVCAICGDPPAGTKKHPMLSVDHDHSTGAVRGLLCVKCNTGLGMFRDSPELLRSAVNYILRATRKVRAA